VEEMKRNTVMIMGLMFGIIFAVGLMAQGSKPETEMKQKTITVESIGNTIKTKETKVRLKRVAIIEDDKGFKRLSIYDADGKVKEEMKLWKPKITKIKAKDKNGKLRNGTQEEIILASISEDGKRVAITRYKSQKLDGVLGYEQPDSTLELEVRDENGEVKWKEEIGKNRAIGMDSDIKICECGLTIVRDALDNENVSGTGELHVFNEKGDKIFAFPGTTGIQAEPVEFVISPNGKYIGIRYGRTVSPYNYSVIFFNLSNGKSWDLGERWGIGNIENNGNVELFSGRTIKNIDLKSKLGE
jgi:hypothetical protein